VEENFKGRPDPVRWNVIQENFKFESAQIATDLTEQVRLEQEMGAAQLVLAELAMNHLATLNGLLAPLIASVRGEIGLPISETILRDILVGSIRSQQHSLNALIVKVRAENLRRVQAPRHNTDEPPGAS
jgi:hypothetical protein